MAQRGEVIDSKVTIRALNLDDYETLITVWQASGLGIRTTGRESRENFATQMATGLQTVLGAEIDGQLAGAVVVTHDGRKGWINRLGVAPEYQRQGVARQLIRAAEDLLHAKGLTIIAVLVEHKNDASRALFESEGFKIDDVYYLTKRDRPDA